MKKAKFNFEEPDLSRWHILTYDELLKVNGGNGSDSDDSDDETVESDSEETSDEGAETATESTTGEEGVGEPSADPTSESTSSGTNSDSESGGHEIENTVEAVANAEVGDTLTRDDGTQVTITQGDIDWAQEHCDSYGKNEEAADSKEAAENAGSATENASESQQVDNSNEAVANAKPGDTLVRDDGTVVTLKEIDIEQAQEKLGIGEHKEDEKSPSKEGELAEKSSGENKNTKGENAAEERAYINSKLDTPKGNNVAGTAVDLLNNTSTCTGVAGELAAEAAKTNLIDAPVLNEFAGNMSKLGNAVIIVDFAYTSYQNTKAYQNGEMSYWQSAYNTATHGISVTAGAVAGNFVFAAGTSATFGFGTIPSAIGGVAASAVTSEGVDWLFDKLEEQIWGEAK